jgi:2,4-dienoyl-CoA reductase-like NADH-dependent reductase (Old Yellow Enzyme family)
MTALLTPLTFPCGTTVKNRAVLAPLTNGQSHDDGTLSLDEQRWLVRRAVGGFGIVETCAVYVQPRGHTFDGQLGLCTDAHEDSVRPLAAAIAATGAVGIVQLQHGGVRSPSRLTGHVPHAPSLFHEEGTKDFEVPKAMSVDEIEATIAAFVSSAVRAERAGFGGVELHAAHGYLLCQFLSRFHNTRDDAFGGDVHRRAFVLRTITQRIRQQVQPGFVVGVRFSAEDRGHARGMDLDDVLQTAQWLVEDGIDFVHLSLWTGAKNSAKYPEQHTAAIFRAALPTSVPIVAAGGVWTKAEAEALEAKGAEFVCVGRAAILDPDWVQHVLVEGLAPVTPPRTPEQLAAVDVSPGFVRYLQRFPGLVAP